MAGLLSHTLWPRSSGRPSSSRGSQSPPRAITSMSPSTRAAWRSPTVDHRVAARGDTPAPPAPRSSSSSSSPPPGNGRPAVRFATPPARSSVRTARSFRPCRAATPFPPSYAAVARGSHLSPDDVAEVHMPTVDMEPSRRLAYAFVDPPCVDPGQFIRLALERHGGDAPVRLAASSYGTMMVVFAHPYFRESVIQRGHIDMGGHQLRLEHHEEAEFRVFCPYMRLVELAATQFPPEHWTEDGINTAFQIFGQVCSIAKSMLREVANRRNYSIADYSVVWVLVLVDENRWITTSLLVRNPNGEISGIAKLRVVGDWPHPLGSPVPDDHQFADDDNDGPPQAERSTPRHDSSGLFRSPTFRPRFPRTESAGGAGGSCRALGAPLYPSVALWTFVSGACTALARALSLAGVPTLVVRDLPTPARPRTPPPPTASWAVRSDNDEITPACPLPPSSTPSLRDLLYEEEHEVSLRKRRVRRRHAAESAFKQRRSTRLAAKEDPYYTDATTKASRVKAAQLDMTKASERLKTAMASSGLLECPAPAKVSSRKLRCLGRVCGLAHMSELDEEVPRSG
ncbi:unnamed protein product [Urochloa humidicola]